MKTEQLETISLADLEHVAGGVDLGLALTPDHAFNDGGFLTNALRRGMAPRQAPSHAAPRPGVTRSKIAPGWCEDGMGIVPCR